MKYTFLLFISTTLFSCTHKSNTSTQKPMDNKTPVIVGSDADSHGCKASAGYTWSVIKNNCIRLWETGIQLSPINNKETYTSVATAIINDDKTKVELFIIGETGSILLDKNAEQSFAENEYSFIQENNKWLLKKEGKAIYKE